MAATNLAVRRAHRLKPVPLFQHPVRRGRRAWFSSLRRGGWRCGVASRYGLTPRQLKLVPPLKLCIMARLGTCRSVIGISGSVLIWILTLIRIVVGVARPYAHEI